MQTNCLQVSEFDKVEALVRWGRAQVLQSGEVEDGSSVRRKIEPCLSYVRFFDLEHHEFAQLCRTVVHDVLSAEEKSCIFESICLSEPELMPIQFGTASGVKSKFSIDLPYKEHQVCLYKSGCPLKSELRFEVDRKVQLVGLHHFVNSFNIIKANFDSFCFQVRKTDARDCLAGGTSGDSLVRNGSEFFRVSRRCILDPGTKYSIDVYYPKMLSGAYYTTSVLKRGKRAITDKGLTLTLYSDFVCVNITRLEFILA
jgi:hypothetical protein